MMLKNLNKYLDSYFAIVEGNPEGVLTGKPVNYHREVITLGNINDEQWSTYYDYLLLVKIAFDQFQELTMQRPKIQGMHLKTMAMKAIQKVNEYCYSNRAKIYNIWDRLGINKPIGAYANFEDSPDIEYLWRMYIQDESLKLTMFRGIDRIKLTKIILDRCIRNKNLIDQNLVETVFSIHNDFELYGTYRFKFSERENYMNEKDCELFANELFAQDIPIGLKNEWSGWFTPPVSLIRNYFGEKIALYFGFLSFYTYMLIIPSLLGIGVFVIQVIYSEGQTVTVVCNSVFAAVMVIWSALFYERWKQHEKKYAVEWGQVDFEEDEVERSRFKGVYRRSPINDKSEKYYSYIKRAIRIGISWTITLLMIGLVIGIIYFTFWLRLYWYNKWKNYWYADYSITLVSIINAIFIIIFNYIYFYLAFILTDFENFKTQTQFEKSLIIKSLVFQFINSYNSLFYIAFLKRENEGCLDYNSQGKLTLSTNNKCFNEIYFQLRSIFVISILKNIVEIGTPFFFEWWSKRSKQKVYCKLNESKEDRHRLLSRIENNMNKSDYNFKELDGTYNEYLELIIQLGYITLFGLSFPLCCVLALINNIIEHQVDRGKIIYFCRRPTPMGCEDIGSWKVIFYAFIIIGSFCYSGVLCITSEAFTTSKERMFTQFVWCSIIFLIIKWSISYLIRDTPENLEIILKRHRRIVDKYLVGMPQIANEDKQKSSSRFIRLATYTKNYEKLMGKSSCDLSQIDKEDRFDSDKLKLKKTRLLKREPIRISDIKFNEKFQNNEGIKGKENKDHLVGVSESNYFHIKTDSQNSKSDHYESYFRSQDEKKEEEEEEEEEEEDEKEEDEEDEEDDDDDEEEEEYKYTSSKIDYSDRHALSDIQNDYDEEDSS